MVLFSIQFSFSLIAYSLIAAWYVVPRLSERPRETALQPLLWVHAFRVAGGAVLAPGAVAAAVPIAFPRLVGYGDLVTAVLALFALAALPPRPARPPGRRHHADLDGPRGGNGGHNQRDHPVDALQRVQPRAGR